LFLCPPILKNQGRTYRFPKYRKESYQTETKGQFIALYNTLNKQSGEGREAKTNVRGKKTDNLAIDVNRSQKSG